MSGLEVAGLVIGGVSLVALLDTTMEAFDKIEAAKAFGKDYQKAALRMRFLRRRLLRWATGINNISKGDSYGTEEDCDEVKHFLGLIGNEIEDSKKYATRYGRKEESATPPSKEDDRELDIVGNLIAKANKLTLHAQDKASFGQKTRWAIRDGNKFSRLIQDVEENLTALEKVFPLEQQIQIQRQLVKIDAQELVRPSEIEEPGEDGNTTMTVLAETTTGVDPLLQEAIKEVVPTGGGLIEIYETQVTLTENAILHQGTVIAKDYKGPLWSNHSSHFKGTFTGGGNTKTSQGTIYGGSGKSVFD